MKKPDMNKLRDAYERGENITLLLREYTEYFAVNTVEAIEIAYDLQAGTYTRNALSNPTAGYRRAEEMGKLLAPYVSQGDKLLDCGTGELTTLSTLSHYLPNDITIKAFDISLSRIRIGKNFANQYMRADACKSLTSFVADIGNIPIDSGSVDVVISMHALEPNHGRECELIKEMLRVCRRTVVLFEPSWEMASKEGRARMEKLGYVRDLPNNIVKAGGILKSESMLHEIANPLNPTCCYIVEPMGEKAISGNNKFICPISGCELERYDGYWWSKAGGWVYPEIEGVPCLRERHAILMTHDISEMPEEQNT